MKYIPFVLILVILSVCAQAVVDETGLCFKWKMDGNLTDTSGNGRNGTMVGTLASSPGIIAPTVNGALESDGSTSYATYVAGCKLDALNNFTVVLWFFRNTSGRQDRMMNLHDAGPNNGFAYRSVLLIS